MLQVVSKMKQVEIQTCLFTLHTFDCLVFKHSWDVQQTLNKKVIFITSNICKTQNPKDKMQDVLNLMKPFIFPFLNSISKESILHILNLSAAFTTFPKLPFHSFISVLWVWHPSLLAVGSSWNYLNGSLLARNSWNWTVMLLAQTNWRCNNWRRLMLTFKM